MAFTKKLDSHDAEGDDVTNDIFVGAKARTWKEHFDRLLNLVEPD